ncbi:MAG: C45 family peptidase, partial [Clostridia bacterium]|nr:C45 family peptidase [Clostridia bacterium]
MLNKHLFPIIVASGTPYEIGFAHGQGAKELIKFTIDTYKAMFWDYSGISWEKACKYARTFIPAIDAYDADYMEEIRGVAEGSGYSIDDILALNVRSEIVFQGAQVEDTDGCTSFVFTPDITDNGHLIIGQNWDWKESIKGACIILNIKQKSKPDIT